MKRLWVFVILCTVFFGIMSPLSLTFAAPPGTFTNATQELINAFTSTQTGAATFQLNYNQKQQQEYATLVNALRVIMATHATNDPASIGNDVFQSRSLMDFKTYIDNRRASQSDPEIQQVLTQTYNLADALHTQISSGMFDASFYLAMSGGASPITSVDQTQNAANTQVEKANTAKEEKCSTIFAASQSFTDCIDKFVAWIIKNTFLQLAGFVLWLTANMLNYSINIGILHFSDWAPDSLYPIWAIIRQIISLFVVFAGLWLGFMYIIGKGDEFKKYVPWIILFGLFVNFSYPLTRSLIDISNVVSLNVYSGALGADTLTAGTPGSNQVNGPGAMIVSKMGLSQLVFAATDSTQNKDILSSIDSTPAALMVVVFVAYAAWVFFMATAILVARTAILVFLIVASPILFVDSIIPKLGEEAMKMRKLFFSQLVVAPIFMIMLALTLKFLDIFGSNLQVGNVTNIGGPGAVTQFFNVLMMLIMLNITLKVTKNVAGTVGDFATKTIGQVGGFALGAATGGTGLIARQTIGRAALAARDSNWVKNNQDSFLGRRAYNMSNAFASSTFDARNNSFVKTNTDKIGLGMGMGAKLGYEATLKERNEDRMARYNRIETRYKKNVYDNRTGELLHREGDVNQEGMLAAAKFKQKQGRNQITGENFIADKDDNAALKRADRFVFNKEPLGGEFEKITNKEVEENLAKIIAGYKTNKNTGSPATKEEKVEYIKKMEAELEKTKQTDPQLATAYGQALVKGLKQMGDTQVKEAEAFNKEVSRVFAEYNAISDDKKQVLLARQSDEMKKALTERINNPQDSQVAGAPQVGEQGQAANNSSYNQPNTAWVGQGNTDIPAYQRQQQAGGAPSNGVAFDMSHLSTESFAHHKVPVSNKPGFLKTAEDKITERDARINPAPQPNQNTTPESGTPQIPQAA